MLQSMRPSTDQFTAHIASRRSVYIQQIFATMDSAKGAVYDAILDAGESCKIDKLDKKRLHLKCLLNSCDFKIPVTLSKKSGLPTITKYIPHHCPPDTHHNFKPAHSVRYLVSN